MNQVELNYLTEEIPSEELKEKTDILREIVSGSHDTTCKISYAVVLDSAAFASTDPIVGKDMKIDLISITKAAIVLESDVENDKEKYPYFQIEYCSISSADSENLMLMEVNTWYVKKDENQNSNTKIELEKETLLKYLIWLTEEKNKIGSELTSTFRYNQSIGIYSFGI